MSSYYPYTTYYSSAYSNEWMFQFFAGLLAIGLGLLMLIGLLFYVFRSIGIYQIAKRRGIRHAWLAWLPVGSAWIAGSISDQYQYVVKGRVKNRRALLTILAAVIAALGAVTAVASVDVVAILTGEILFGSGNMDPGHLLTVLALAVLSLATEVAYSVFYLLALYDIYRSCTSRYNVLYLVLSIVFNFLEPFFLFACRNLDEGMPPRREAGAYREAPMYQQEQPEGTWTK